MKINIFVMILLASLMIISCDKSSDESNAVVKSEIVLSKNGEDYAAAYTNRSPAISSPFDLQDISVKGDNVELTVAYSGGCKKHNFEIIWDDKIDSGNPAVINMIVIHHDNDDICEANIKENLKFTVADFLDNIVIKEYSVDVSSGYSPDDSIVYSGSEYDFNFEESDTCNTIVEAKRAICGIGLYQDLWFALEDQISAGIEGYYFNKYLQPVDIAPSLSAFVPVAGEKYLIGGRIAKDNAFNDVPVCLAYPGPSIPIKITCIQHIEQ
jgi:hypothetical protein